MPENTPPRVLVTGFEPFGGDSVNPSMQAVLALIAAPPPGIDLRGEILPVSHARTPRVIRSALARHRPDLVIATGEASGRAEISVERIGINVNDFRVADNDGEQPADVAVIEGGPAAWFATIPVKAIVASLREAGIPAHVSNSAGTHLCNHTLYLLGHLAASEYPGMKAGFIHLPALPEQAARRGNTPSMTTATVVAALRLAIATALGPAGGLSGSPAE
jgi:pyroglutamyl-peptidase